MITEEKSLVGYLDKQGIETWGDILCNAFCMPAVCIESYEDANIKVRITLEVIGNIGGKYIRMKKFEKDGKINFVDENNVFVGFDFESSCCENADWFISDKEKNDISSKYPKFYITSYIFDTKYFEKVECSDVSEGGMVRFKLICKDKPDLFLHLFNCHNGYYSHGFEAKINGVQWQEGSL